MEQVGKIGALQQQVSLFQTLVTRHSGSPMGSPAIVRRRRKAEQEEEEGKEVIGLLSPLLIRKKKTHVSPSERVSMCAEHSWDCVAGQRPARLGFLEHQGQDERLVAPVASGAGVGLASEHQQLCLKPCCHDLNTRLFGCVGSSCWGRSLLADAPCPSCLPGYTREEGIKLEDEPGEVLGFIRHGEPGLPVEFARQVGKSLEPVTCGEELCNSPCCLFDNMMIFRADNWTALTNVRLLRRK